jgi:mono/diheme cytochrome c family protein
MTQLQRFIDYGLITGIASPSDVLPLEQSEGNRAPRSEYELLAQGYMLGNCAHCHNPNGYPSQLAPVLKDVLNFLPTPDGGIFQFPLERTSPRIFRGAIGQTPIPYITPSLMDLPRSDLAGGPIPDPFILLRGGGGTQFVAKAMYAPWRSLIYRNVDDSFAYTDDLALYPHMPMNTPGFDPRARQIMSDWMVSIPAIRKNPNIPEYAFFSTLQPIFNGSSVDREPQPYVEVLAGDPRYASAQAAATQRLKILHEGTNPNLPADPTVADGGLGDAGPREPYTRYHDPGETEDVVDPAVIADPVCHSVPTPASFSQPAYFINSAIPAHPHWVITDATQPPGDWAPRRPDWADVLVLKSGATSASSCVVTGDQSSAHAQEDERTAVDLLGDAKATPPLDPATRDYLIKPVAFGLWQKKPGCNFSSVRTVASFAGSERPMWMDHAQGLSPDDPVYMQSPGQAVFKMICINCHGAHADSNGRLAQNLATMTGGLAQVADFRDGLFGPVGATADKSAIHRVFGALPAAAPDSWKGLSDDDRAARYMAWMALGGTKVHIPAGILQIVALTQVLDRHRLASAADNQLSANMLSTAKGICSKLLGCHDAYENCALNPDYPIQYSKTLIHTNGDAELWLRLCSLNNPPPVHVMDGEGTSQIDAPFDANTGQFVYSGAKLLKPDAYPGSAPVGGNTSHTLGPDNPWPWCEYDHQIAQMRQWPECPAVDATASKFDVQDAETWAVRGAINAGLAVFLYVKSLESMDPPPDYNQCEQLR